MALNRVISVVLTANNAGLNAGLRTSVNEVQRFGSEVKKSSTGLAQNQAAVRSNVTALRQQADVLRRNGQALAANTLEAEANKRAEAARLREQAGLLRKQGQALAANTLEAKANSLAEAEATKVSKAHQAAMLGMQAAAVAAGAALAYTVTEAIEFDSAMRNVNSLLHQSEPQFQAMEQRLIGMSKTLPQSATTLAEGMYDIVSSGFQGADAMKVLQSAAEGASAGLTTTEISARAITATLNAYGLKADSAADVTDVLFQTVNAGVISFEELAGNLGDVVGQASAASVGIDQVGSAIATMTLSGVGGAEATTLLSNVFQKLIQPSDALAAQYKKMGYESGASALKQKGLRGVMEDLRKATGGNIESLMTLIPDMQAARGALALMSDEGRNYARVSAQIEDKEARQGATLRTLQEQMKSAKNQITMFKNNIDATAITIGTKLLPVLIKMMNGMQVAGHEVGGVLQEIGRALGPTWASLAATLHNLGVTAGDLVDTFGPLVAILGRLAIGALVVTLNTLAQALETASGLVADHSDLVAALAIAYGVHLLRGLVLVNGGLKVAAWKAFGTVLIGAMNSAEGLAGALRGLAASQALASAGVTAVALIGVSAWSGYRRGVNDVKEATDALNTSMRSTDFSAMVQGAKAGEAALARIQAKINEQANAGLLEKIFDVGDNYQGIALMRNMDGLADSVEKANDRILAVRGNVYQYLRDSSNLQGGALNAYLESLLHDTGRLDAEVAKLSGRAKAAGVDLAAPYPALKAKLDAAGNSSSSLADKQKALIIALGQVGGKATSAADAADALKSALDALLGVSMSADEANDKWQASLDGLTKSLKDNGRTLSSNTEKGRANRSAIRDSVGALRDKIEADAKAGKSAGDLSKTLTDGIKALYAQGKAADFPKKKMEALLKQYNLTPELVETIVAAIGADASTGEVKKLQAQIKALKGKEVGVGAKGPKESTAKVDTMNARIKALKGKIVEVKDKGAKDSDKRVEDLHEEIARLQTKHDIMFKTPGLDASERKIKNLRDAILAIPNRSVSVSVATGISNKLGAMNAAEKGDGYGMDEVKVNASSTGTGKAISGVASALKKGANKAEEAGGALGGGGGAGMGYRKQWNIIHNAFPGARLHSGFRPGAITATGNKSYHGKGRAVDLTPSMAIFNWIRSHYGRSTKELIYSPAGSRQLWNGRPHMYTGVTRRMHFDHVHWAMKKGGVINDRLPKQATIARNGADLVQWAEAGTGGEAFIPLGANNRDRSKAILAQVAEKFGMAVADTEDAIAQYATGGFHYPRFKYKGFKAPKYDKGEGRKAYRKRYKEAQSQYFQDRREAVAQYYQNRDQAAEAWRDQQRLWAVATGRSEEGRQQWAGGSAAGAVSNIGSAYEARAQASAQAKANGTRSQSDTATDFYRKPVINARMLTSGLGVEIANTKRWGAELTKIAAVAGTDVAASLERMGTEGRAAVSAMSRATTADMKKMAAQMRALDFAKFTADTAANARESAQFQGNLVALVKMGRADLASQFAAMGYEQAGSLAAQAVKDPKGAATLAQYGKTLEAGNAQGMQDALRLASLIQGGRGRMGVMGLATKSGMGIADVLGLLTTYNGSVFSKMGVAAMRQIRTDQALLQKGKQPSGLANGGIVTGAATSGLYYRWAEQGSGGESLIPHSPSKRARAMALYGETGRILGVQAAARPNTGAGVSVVIAPGAVSVTIPVSQPGASVDQIRAVANTAVDQALTGLSHRLKAGVR